MDLLEPRRLMAASASHAVADALPRVTILPLGDSITKGTQQTLPSALFPGGYRTALYDQLTAAGLAVDLVGSDTASPGPTLTAAGEPQHEGHSGYRADQILANLTGDDATPGNNGGYWLDGTPTRPAVAPDYVLLHIGTNDIRAGATVDTVVARLDAILQTLTAKRPEARVLVAGIIPNLEKAAYNDAIRRYDRAIRTSVVPKFQASGASVQYVDAYGDFVDAADKPIAARLPDRLHPDGLGYHLMGTTWANAVKADLIARGRLPGTTPMTPKGSIGGHLFNDGNGDAIKNFADTFTGARQVFLDANGNRKPDAGETTLTSNADGTFRFLNLPDGTYRVTRVFPAGYKLSNSPAGYVSVTVAAGGRTVSDVRLGSTGVNVVPPAPTPTPGPTPQPAATASIDGKVFAQISRWHAAAAATAWTVFLDANKNGTRDADDIFTTAKSDLTYAFAKLPAGTHTVTLAPAAGWTIKSPIPQTFTITLKPGQAKTGQNFVVAKV